MLKLWILFSRAGVINKCCSITVGDDSSDAVWKPSATAHHKQTFVFVWRTTKQAT